MKVSSFDSSKVKLTTDNDFVKNHLSERWVVQFVGNPGFDFQTKDGLQHKTNVHYVCPYKKFDFGWGVYPWGVKFVVKEFDFERGVVIVDGIDRELEFHVDLKNY